MESNASNASARVAPAGAKESTVGAGAASTRLLLANGVLVGPFYLVLGIAQGFIRDGFDFKRHALSHLANGPGGWVQTANFVLSGLMVIAAAIGFARVLGAKSRASWFLGAFGACMLAGAIFRADPVYGLPPGTSMADPTTISTSGMMHFIAGALGFVSLGVSALVTARTLSRRNESSLARVSLVSGLAVLLGFFGGGALSSSAGGIAGIWFAVVAGWAWLLVISRHFLQRVVSGP